MLALSEDIFEGRSFSSFCQDGLGSDLYEELVPTKSCIGKGLFYSSDDELCLEESSLIPSCSTSVASSEHSDNEYTSYIDVNEDLPQRIEGPCLDDDYDLLCWPSPRRKRRHSSNGSTFDRHEQARESHKSASRKPHCKKTEWSALSPDEQVSCLEDLIKTVSQRLDLREQLELIKMISPDANVSPTDTEFFIDLELFDDEKFSRVSEFIERRLTEGESSERSSSKAQQGRRRSVQSNKDRKNLSKSSYKRNNLVTKKRLDSHVTTKSCKQRRKEKQSGLFLKEEVISLHRPRKDSDCDDEIDIIT